MCSTGRKSIRGDGFARAFSELAQWNVQMLGTDLSDEVLNRAREAKFSQIEVNRGLSANC